MRIPLDYYRILGLPIQATAEQLQQAYRDRALQLPRREYSDLAIAARKQLLDQAYAILSDPEQRSVYDSTFLPKSNQLEKLTHLDSDNPEDDTSNNQIADAVEVNVDPYNPSLDISNEQFVGALLILHELGEYEPVLKLGRPYLSGGSASVSLDKGRFGDPHLIRPDIVLTIALACLELGREQWQQAQYENAALSLETGQELLLRESLFPSVRGEIQSDLFKLRPYRILELLALPEKNLAERRSGLQLLQDMLQERGGIDGNAEDQSGLSIDDFLRFIQQLRGYLTSYEQQTLFEAEARRPSAVATYLAVYALLARGFGQRLPSLISSAKQMLIRLSKRQDVYLEQAVCCLLLGQTEEASEALEQSQETETITFIREHSQGAPDLLPGLCLYAERWLQTEVFTHFRDLVNQQVSLREYFADEQVQAYLENLPDDRDTLNEWVVEQRVSYAPATVQSQGAITPTDSSRQSESATGSVIYDNGHNPQTQIQGASNQDSLKRESAQIPQGLDQPLPPKSQKNGVANTSNGNASQATRAQIPTAERISTTTEPNLAANDPGLGQDSSTRQRRQNKPTSKEDSPLFLPPSRIQSARGKFNQFSGNLRQRPLVAGIFGLGVLGLLAIAIYGLWQNSLKNASIPGLEGKQLLVQLDRPPLPIPEPETTAIASDGPLTEKSAQQIIQTWLTTKKEAFGPDRAIDKLPLILTEPALSTWQKRTQTAKRNNSQWDYKHSFEVKSVQTTNANLDRAKVEVLVNEVAQLYQNGKLNQNSSYDDKLRVRYELVRKDTQWRIRDMVVLK